MTLTASVHPAGIYDGVLNCEFRCEVSDQVACKGGHASAVLLTAALRGAWNVRIQRVTIEYSADATGIRFCPKNDVEGCDEGRDEGLAVVVPGIAQGYWKDAWTERQVRACAHHLRDPTVNVPCKVEAEYEALDGSSPGSSMHLVQSVTHIRR